MYENLAFTQYYSIISQLGSGCDYWDVASGQWLRSTRSGPEARHCGQLGGQDQRRYP